MQLTPTGDYYLTIDSFITIESILLMSYLMYKHLKVLPIAVGLLVAGSSAWATDLVVSVKGVRSPKGQISAQLLKANPEKGVAESFAGLKVSASTPETELHFKDLPPGDYCIMVFHDENDNGKMDTNLLGIPVEGYGFSNDAHGSFGPPKFKQMKFTVVEGQNAKTSASLTY